MFPEQRQNMFTVKHAMYLDKANICIPLKYLVISISWRLENGLQGPLRALLQPDIATRDLKVKGLTVFVLCTILGGGGGGGGVNFLFYQKVL